MRKLVYYQLKTVGGGGEKKKRERKRKKKKKKKKERERERKRKKRKKLIKHKQIPKVMLRVWPNFSGGDSVTLMGSVVPLSLPYYGGLFGQTFLVGTV